LANIAIDLDRALAVKRREGVPGRTTPRVLAQGEGSKSELLARFRDLGNAVLLGSASFWEGVDVPGDALSVVVIDKLPFAPPDDPLLAARLEHLRAAGGNPFFEVQVPQAAIALNPNAPESLSVGAPTDPSATRNQVENDVNDLFLLLGLVSLIVGAIGIANVTLVSVAEPSATV